MKYVQKQFWKEHLCARAHAHSLKGTLLRTPESFMGCGHRKDCNVTWLLGTCPQSEFLLPAIVLAQHYAQCITINKSIHSSQTSIYILCYNNIQLVYCTVEEHGTLLEDCTAIGNRSSCNQRQTRYQSRIRMHTFFNFLSGFVLMKCPGLHTVIIFIVPKAAEYRHQANQKQKKKLCKK